MSLLNAIIRRECNKCRCVLPFSIKLIARNSSVNSSNDTVSSSRENERMESNKSQFSNDKSIESNPYYAKYAMKIESVKNENRKTKENTFFDDKSNSKTDFNDHKSSPKVWSNPKSGKRFSKSLNDIIKIELFKDKTFEEISLIWREYHKDKDCIFAVIPSQKYDTIFSRASQYPTFVYPVPRMNKSQNHGDAYEFVLSQFVDHQCFFTPLIAYQRHKENAPPCLTIAHYPELQFEKGIVLMFGEYDTNILNGYEAQCIANQLQVYYGGDNLKHQLLLHTFNKEPNQFQYMDVIKELNYGFEVNYNK